MHEMKESIHKRAEENAREQVQRLIRDKTFIMGGL